MIGSVYKLGYEAGAARKDIDKDNPYTAESHWWNEWRRGYHDATR